MSALSFHIIALNNIIFSFYVLSVVGVEILYGCWTKTSLFISTVHIQFASSPVSRSNFDIMS